MNYFHTPPNKLRCEFVNSVFATIAFSLSSIIFIAVILANHGVASDQISFYFHTSRNTNKEFIIGDEMPGVICLVASITYLCLAILSFKLYWGETSSRLSEIADAIFIPLFLCAIIMLTDFLHIVFMVCNYVVFCLCLNDLIINKRDAITFILWASIISLASFIVGYLTALFLNWNESKPGTGEAELFPFMFLITYDLYRLRYLQNLPRAHELLKSIIRLVLIASIFPEEIQE